MRRRALTLLSLTAGGLLLLALSQSTGPVTSAQQQPKLSGALQKLLEQYAGGLSQAQSYAQTQGFQLQGAEARLAVVVEGMGDLGSQIRAQQGTLQAKYKGLWQAELPLGNLPALAQATPVSYIRLPQTALSPLMLLPSVGTATQREQIISEGVALIGADQLHAKGFKGQGIKVGIIDVGFAGVDRIIERGELPQSVVAWNCLGAKPNEPVGCRRVSPAELSAATPPRGGAHGTAVAEIIHDVAPEAQLHLFLATTEVELGQALTKATDEEIRVINHSVAWFNDGNFYTGRGLAGDAARTAYQHGILWVNAAGNFARTHYEAVFQDRDGDRFHDTPIELDLRAGQSVIIWFTWDAWPRTHEDFDLFLERGPKPEANSINKQNGTEPDEKIFFTAQETGAYRLRIKWVGEGVPPANRRMELFVHSSPDLRQNPVTPESSLPEPSNAAEAFAIGAVGAIRWEVGEPEPFSSWGPTNDGRAKPDLVAPDCVRTATTEGVPSTAVCGVEGRFAGTSAAAPHVAGAAALLLSQDPKRTAEDLMRLFTEQARPARGTVNQVGAGKANVAPEEALPDLVIVDAELEPREIQAGTVTPVSAHARVRNAGGSDAGPFWVTLWRAEEEGQTGRELASVRISQGLAAGADREISLKWNVPAQEPVGEKRLVLVADPFGDVREKNKENNRQELRLMIRPQVKPPFFAVSALEVSSNPKVNMPVLITATVKNTGEEAGTKDVWLEIDGREVDRQRGVRLGINESTTVRFTRTFSTAGKITVKVVTPDDFKTETITLTHTRIVFFSDRDGNTEIYVMNADGSVQTRLTTDAAADEDPVWSPDGTKIAFTSRRDGNWEIYVMNANGSNPIRLTRSSDASDWDPAWSPDGKKIAFTSYRDGNADIYVMNADGSNLVRLTTHTAWDSDPAWSPDGKKIAFVSNRDGNSEIYAMNADGSSPSRLTSNSAWDGDPAWSPDGSRIVFASQRDGNSEIYVMQTNGTNQTRLTSQTADDSQPSWAFDGTKIAFISNRAGNYEIYLMDADGSNLSRLTSNSAHDGHPSWSSQ